MNYIPHTDSDRQLMLDLIGVDSLDHLFDAVPEKYRFPRLDIAPSVTEQEITREMLMRADQNADINHHACFLGAGAYNHFTPSLVDHIIRRGEFFTAYTPYQPEVSQGTLQAIFEFQSMIGQLTGMEVCTASHYDGATAFTEAVLMAANTTRRSKVIISPAIHPQYRQVMRTYTQFHPSLKIEGDYNQGNEIGDLVSLIDDQTACLCISNPNFFGQFEDVTDLADKVHAAGAMLVVCVNPISLGLFQAPSEYNADIVVGEGQPLGVPISFGGPYLGFFCTTRQYMRRIPGRIVGETVDKAGQKGYVLTLKTREQDIRREKATSNICTNQGLMALCACVYMSVVGKHGLQQIANLNYQKAHYAADEIGKLDGYTVDHKRPFFNEFVVKCPVQVGILNSFLFEKHGLIGGYDLAEDYAHLNQHMLICCTEMNTRNDIDRLISALRELG